MLLLAVALLLGGAACATSPGAAAVGIEDVVTTRAGGTTVGIRRRQLARRLDVLHRRRTRRPTERLRRERAVATPGREVAASVRGPPDR